MSVLQLTIEQSQALITQNVNSAEMATVDLVCDLDKKMNKGGRACSNTCFGKGMTYRTTINGVAKYDYTRAVNRVAAKEGKAEREAKAHPWGDRDDKGIFRVHRATGMPYLILKVENQRFDGYFNADGSPATAEQLAVIEQYKKPSSGKSSTQSDLEGEVIEKCFAMSSIKAIRMRGIEIEVVPAS